MGETSSYWVFGIAVALLLLSSWRSRRDHAPGRLPLVPWTAIQYVSLVVAVLLLAHLISIWTGKPFLGRRG